MCHHKGNESYVLKSSLHGKAGKKVEERESMV